MNKKIVALALALALCLTTVAAFATDSKTTGDVSTVATPTEQAAVTVAEPTGESKAELDAIDEFVTAGEPVVNYFDETVKTEIAAAIPAEVDVSTLKMDEYLPLESAAPIEGDAELTLTTAATYTEDDAVVVLGGIVKGDKVEWQVLPHTIVDGKIVVQAPAAFTAEIANGNAIISVLSNVAK